MLRGARHVLRGRTVHEAFAAPGGAPFLLILRPRRTHAGPRSHPGRKIQRAHPVSRRPACPRQGL